MYMYTTGIIQPSQAFFMYTNTDYNVHGAFPLLFVPLANSPLSPFAPLSDPLLLTWNPPSCDRIRPPQSQVACKLTSSDPPFSQTLPLQIPRTQLAQRLTTTTSGPIRRLLSGTIVSCCCMAFTTYM
jgi:hypothetical protein